MRTPHTSCQKGKRVYVVFRDSTFIVSKFVQKKGGCVYLESGKYPINTIKSLSICGINMEKRYEESKK